MTNNQKKIADLIQLIVFFLMLGTIYHQAMTIRTLQIEAEPCATVEMIEQCIKQKEGE